NVSVSPSLLTSLTMPVALSSWVNSLSSLCLFLPVTITLLPPDENTLAVSRPMPAVPAQGSMFSFAGCTVAPGFDFADFELGEVETLSSLYPAHEKIIKELCR
ncbi:MAG: hypothetical protein ABI416_01665, partial [Ginsengibacter sp.]